MQRSDSFCPKCGHLLQFKIFENKEILECSACEAQFYFDPKVAAVCVLSLGEQVLLIKRGNEPGYGKWSLPGGYVDRFEVVEDAVKREINEEIGLTVNEVELMGVYSTNDSPVIVVAYKALSFTGTILSNDEVLDCQSFTVDKLPNMAFIRDEGIIRKAIKS
jgi:ADP-ribose pyrophosphatase YjhB (NUDIX family)